MYDNSIVGQKAAMAQVASNGFHKAPTVSENIDNRIAHYKAEIARLEAVKVALAEPAGILKISIDDLRSAMNY